MASTGQVDAAESPIRVSPPEQEDALTTAFGTLWIGTAWLVPAAVVGGPGLLVLLWLALQLVAGLVWLPAARRIRGDGRRRP